MSHEVRITWEEEARYTGLITLSDAEWAEYQEWLGPGGETTNSLRTFLESGEDFYVDDARRVEREPHSRYITLKTAWVEP